MAGVTHDQPNPISQGEDDHDHAEVSVHLQQLITDTNTSPEVLESAVETGTQLIDNLVVPLVEDASDHDAAAWLKRLKELQARAKTPRTVVGVVGNTGAGKSSVINALLDEER